ncbi:MAG: ABC transporter permease subunit [Acidimicrobiales bacterium]
MPASTRAARGSRAWWTVAAVGVAVVAVVPVAAVLGGVLEPDGEVWRQQWQTRLPGQIRSSLLLVTGVAIGTISLGVGLAWLVGAHDFPGRRAFSWALVLPLAVPAYILGFVVTSVLGVAGPVQGWWRDSFGRDAWFPEVRSLPVAIATFSLTLYPYVYLLARAALRDQAGESLWVARCLGAGRAEAFRRVVLPMLRPVGRAGAAIARRRSPTSPPCSTSASTPSPSACSASGGAPTTADAAAQIASLVLLFAVVVIALERISRGGACFAEAGIGSAGFARQRLRGPGRPRRPPPQARSKRSPSSPGARLVTWRSRSSGAIGARRCSIGTEFLRNSLVLTLVTVGLCVVLGARDERSPLAGSARRWRRRTATVGYAVPGPVVAMGVVIALVASTRRWARRAGPAGHRGHRIVPRPLAYAHGVRSRRR